MLNICISLKSMPHFTFGHDSLSQFRQCIFLSPCECPHQKFIIRLLIYEYHVLGKRNILIVNAGIKDITEFSKTSLPALFISRCIHPRNFCWTWSLMKANASLLNLPQMVGSLKYFLRSTTSFILIPAFIAPCVLILVFPMKNMYEFLILTVCLEAR